MEWQPIETAPRDEERPIMVYRASRCAVESIFIGEWDEGEQTWRIHIDGQRIEPTHWMPLPDPPNA